MKSDSVLHKGEREGGREKGGGRGGGRGGRLGHKSIHLRDALLSSVSGEEELNAMKN